jgi:hypothetical protein
MQRRTFSIRTFFYPVVMTCCFVLSLCHNAKAQVEWEDWPRLQEFEKSIADLKKAEPQAALLKYREFFAAHPRLHPISGSTLFSSMADLQRNGLKKPEEALDSYNRGLQLYQESPAVVILLAGKAKTLREMGKHQEAAALADEWWSQIREAGRSGHPHFLIVAPQVLWEVTLALEAQVPGAGDKSAERGEPGERDEQAGVVVKAGEATSHAARVQWIALLQKSLLEMPVFLDDRKQGVGEWFQGWMFRHLLAGLIQEGRAEEALQWGKLYWMTCSYDEKALANATRFLGRAWTALDKDVDVLTFVQAQSAAAGSDAQKNNPLLKVKLPAPNAEAGEYLHRRWQQLAPTVTTKSPDVEKARELISLALVAGAMGRAEAMPQAMTTAQAVMNARPGSLDGAREVARVFKAIDLNTVRANAVVAYVNGKGSNPVPAFFKEQQEKSSAAGVSGP